LKAIVTGARGFIGSFLVEELLASGLEVFCLLRQKKAANDWLAGLPIQIIAGDILQSDSLQAAVKEMDYVFHLAGLTKAISREQFYEVNVLGTINLLDAVRDCKSNIKRFVLVSSLAAAGPSLDGKPLAEADSPRPISDYGRSKLQAEQAALDFARDVPISIVRPPAVFGPRDRDVFTFFKFAHRGWWPTMSGGPRYASLVYVKDLARGMVAAAKTPAAVGQTYYLCNDDFCSWDEVAEMLSDIFARPLRRIIVPISLAFLAATASDFTGKILQKTFVMNLDKFQELKATHWICDNSKAKKECGFHAQYGLLEALAETAEWYQTNGWL